MLYVPFLAETRWHTQPKTHAPPLHFLYLTETKSWRCEGKGNENVHPLTHASTRAMGKKCLKNRNKGTINVLQGGGSAEYGQRPHFYIFCWDPSLSQLYLHFIATNTLNYTFMSHLFTSPASIFILNMYLHLHIYIFTHFVPETSRELLCLILIAVKLMEQMNSP